MDHDDRIRGRVLSRREVLALLGATGAFLLTGCSEGDASDAGEIPSGCAVRPELTEGPYFVDELLNRSDIRSDPSDGSIRPGTLLQLTFSITRVVSGGCTPIAGALVDLWHCDHLGWYSDVADPGFDTTGKKFLRGYQVTDADGTARFTTIYPGWYPGRAVHMHFKIRSDPQASAGYEFTSQLFFDDALSDQVHALAPYSEKGQRTRRNSGDGIYNQGGSQLVLAATGNPEDGFAAAFDLALEGV